MIHTQNPLACIWPRLRPNPGRCLTCLGLCAEKKSPNYPRASPLISHVFGAVSLSVVSCQLPMQNGCRSMGVEASMVYPFRYLNAMEETMNAFYEHHKDNIQFKYRCFDRILLNGLIQPFQQPERVLGFFNAYREGKRVTRKVLTEIADQFQYWVKNRSEKWGAPIVEAPEEKRRDDFVQKYLRGSPPIELPSSSKRGSRPASCWPSGERRTTALTWSSSNVGSTSTTSTSTTSAGAGCLCAGVPTFPSPRGYA